MTDHRPFPGFPSNALATAVPNAFFADVLPEIDDPAELIVTAYAFYALGRRRAADRWLTAEQLASEAPLRRAIAKLGPEIDGRLREGLEAAVRRGSLLAVTVVGERRYAINNAIGRRTLMRTALEAGDRPAFAAADEPPPTIYALYEDAIGTLSPLLADELRAAEEEFPAGWIQAAFREAAAQNRRSWRYVARILERWRNEGRDDAAIGRDSRAGRDLAGRYRGLIRR